VPANSEALDPLAKIPEFKVGKPEWRNWEKDENFNIPCYYVNWRRLVENPAITLLYRVHHEYRQAVL
jgi:hypothetical protein